MRRIRLAAPWCALGLLSAAALALQITLTRFFSIQQFHNFAFVVISLAMLGSAAGGSLLAVFPRVFKPAFLCALFSLATVGGYLLLNFLPFDSFSLAWDRRQLLLLTLYFSGAGLPFFFAGLYVGGTLAQAGPRRHQAYAVNLAGSATGSMAALLLLGSLRLEGTVLLVAAVGLLAASFAFLPRTGRGAILALAAALALGGGAWHPPAVLAPRLSPYKGLSTTLLAAGARHTLMREDANARVDVVESGSVHMLPGLSLNADLIPPAQAALFVDGDSATPITSLDAASQAAAKIAEHMPNALAFRLRPNADVLILGGGGGLDPLLALASGARAVTVVEENRLTLEALLGPYRDFSANLYGNPRLTVVSRSMRSFARSAPGHYDIVLLSLTDPYRPITSGAFSLSETYTLTREAFQDDLRLLAPQGLLLMTRWLQTPPSEEARAFATLASAAQGVGITSPGSHAFAFRSMRTVTMGLGSAELGPEEVSTLRTFLLDQGYDAVYFPGMRPEEGNRINVQPGSPHAALFADLVRDPGSACRQWPFEICPATDERPFFFHFFKWTQAPAVLAGIGTVWEPFGGSGYFVLLALLAFAVLASLFLIFGPLLARGRFPRGGASFPAPRDAFGRTARILVYFSSLGVAYMFVEIPLAQRAILVLERAAPAYAVVISSLLLFSGIGSLLAPRMKPGRVLVALGISCLALALCPWLWEPLLPAPLPLRGLLVALSLAPLGLLMGVPFVRGLARVETVRPGLTPWVWAVNGAASVVGALLAALVALSGGFAFVLGLGACAYVLALAALPGAGPIRAPSA